MKNKDIKEVIKEANHFENQQFAQKVKSPEEILKIIGKRPKNKPRERKVVMCHGTFDIVHPGHLRQLIFAKSKAGSNGILVVSITTDKHVTKGPLRPYVPQELRAIHIAAFQIVDYVLIDENPTPVKNILKLKPDIFVKGFEYSQNGVNPKTQEEIKALERFGGEMIFSPGDIVYSSSQILTFHEPDLTLEKLATLMAAEKVSFEDLNTIIDKFNKISIHVVGDLIIDKYSYCTLLGQAQKHPALSTRLDKTQVFIGGAGIVAQHLNSLGASVTFTTVIGDDKEGALALKLLNGVGIKVNAIVDSTRPTSVKERFIEGKTLLLQVNRLENRTISEKILSKIRRSLQKNKSNGTIFSDFRHGIFNVDTIPSLIKSIPKGSIKVADSQVSNRWGNILDFNNFDLITPNEKEARFALGDQDTTIRPLAQKLYNKAKCRFLILKLGADGLIAYRSPGGETREYFVMDSFAKEVIDPIGVGDALLAGATLALITSNNILLASIIGNVCAAIECSKQGNIPIAVKELKEQIKEFQSKTI